MVAQAPTVHHAVTQIGSYSGQRFGCYSTADVSGVQSPTQRSSSSGTKGASNRSAISEVWTSGRVAFLRGLFQEEDSPIFFQYGCNISPVTEKSNLDDDVHTDIEETMTSRGPKDLPFERHANMDNCAQRVGDGLCQVGSIEGSSGKTPVTRPKTYSANSAEQLALSQNADCNSNSTAPGSNHATERGTFSARTTSRNSSSVDISESASDTSS
ncbi:hypothetical protein BWQ96_01747 [Gracilariopsis chorda]|uniref:Uncharacterized protein n=1 Tax=Gracilariopsis chorda TaxID=448386 RepID=A0A2V3J2E7_9FLOR|nr:hypothetical protein BWQ96_01747 [Gracilariopsis chorda]|eukprot:PXF48578.1 hypothetical protein BWQ96_01747 [Gracilariopsis chorda]